MISTLLAALLAVAQQAGWAQDSREPLCVYDGLMAAAEAGTMDDGRIPVVRNECRQRFGWTDPQADTGVVVAYLTVQALQARNEAVEAGVSIDTIEAVLTSFTESERALIPAANAPAPVTRGHSRGSCLTGSQPAASAAMPGARRRRRL